MIITLTIHLLYLIFSLGGVVLLVLYIGSAAERTNASFMNYIEYSRVTKILLRGPI
jgi:hypothetical protein